MGPFLGVGDLAAGASWQVPYLTSDPTPPSPTPIASPPIPPPLRRDGTSKGGLGQISSSLDEWGVPFEPPDDLHQQERALTAALQGDRPPIPSALRAAHRPEVVPTRTSGAQPPSQTRQKAV
ncbi:hypothetical protein GWK47_031916 [Chionoecetes opilio]|uniref:Uncharacterized protein n=1 Tax=Chionoecetes opilio TaxID=41210 RepID=A0A8J4Z0P6_CHIOP|nr:hypothetical protein GWK47_031916 [Chionoecetes opilio]